MLEYACQSLLSFSLLFVLVNAHGIGSIEG